MCASSAILFYTEVFYIHITDVLKPLPFFYTYQYVNTMNIYIPQHCRPIFALPTDGYSCPHVPYFFRFSWREQNTMELSCIYNCLYDIAISTTVWVENYTP